jgi:hypothetical protein
MSRYVLHTQPSEGRVYEPVPFSDYDELLELASELPDDAWPVRLQVFTEIAPSIADAVKVIEDALKAAAAEETSTLYHPDMEELLSHADDLHVKVWEFASELVRRIRWPHRPDVMFEHEPLTAETITVLQRWAPGLR